MNFLDTVARTLEIYRSTGFGGGDLRLAASLANDEAGGEWNVPAVQKAAYNQIYNR
jgi:hypothetical protein